MAKRSKIGHITEVENLKTAKAVDFATKACIQRYAGNEKFDACLDGVASVIRGLVKEGFDLTIKLPDLGKKRRR